ncbi:LLM class flavin-dependent oxidoreductase [Nonomuraea sp. B19D2]|uniref:LLM class flavin-dependent oxidoreductase n=1 Tax=Nonomuraea sp. B19D2 TaxID=3159561 RepID=UPI0032DB2025
MVEAIDIIRGLWSEPRFTYEGTRYHTYKAAMEPKPAGSIPIWLGTYGKRALDATGRLADGWIPSLGFAPPEQAAVMRERILSHGRAVECVYNVPFRIGERAGGAAVVAGSPQEVTDRLAGFARLGFTSMNFMPVGPNPREQSERLAMEILPALRATATSSS